MDSRALRLFALCALVAALVAPLSASGAGVGIAAAGPSISGNVYDAGGAPRQGITVNLWVRAIDGTWDVQTSQVSLANGAYAFLGLLSNKTYAVEFVDGGGTYVPEFYDGLAGVTVEGATHIFIPAGGSDVFDVDAYMGRAGGISGTVRNSGGAPVPDIAVNAYRHFGGGSFATTIAAKAVSKADGTYALGGLGGGSYALQFNQSGSPYATHFYSTDPTSGAVSKSNATPVAVSVGATTTGIDATMLGWAGLEGTVRGTGGEAVNGALVELYRWEGGTWSKQSDSANATASGGYALPHHLYPGMYRVRISGAAGYPAQYHLSAIPIAYAIDVPIAELATASLDTTLLASDAVPPVSTTTPLPSGWVSHTVTATLTAVDELDGSGLGAIYWTLDSAPPTTYAAPVAIAPEGAHDFRFWAVDRFANVEAEHTTTVRIDKSAPLTESDASGLWSSEDVTVSLTASDALSGVHHTVVGTDGAAPSGYAGPFCVTKEGITTIDFLSVDNVGNEEPARHATVRIDTTPPTTTASGFVDGAWRATSANVALTPSDVGGSGLAQTWYSVDSVVGSGTAFVVSGEGTHAVAWGSVDAVGNREQTCTAEVRIDTTPPTTTASGFTDGAWRATSADVTLVPSDAGGSEVASTWYSVDSLVASGTAFTVSGSGIHAVEYGSVDSAGNRETTHTATISIDTSPPVTGASGFIDGVWRNASANVTLTPGDIGGSGIKSTWYSVDGALAESGTAFTVGGEGVHAIEWGSIDALDNREATRSATIRIDLTPPVTTGAYGGSGIFTLSSSDTGGSGLAGTWYRLDGVGWTFGTSITAGSGSHTVEFYSTDNAGNVESPVGSATFTVVADTPVPPTPPPSDPPVVAPTLPKASLTRPYARSYTVYRYRSVPVYGFLKPRHTAGATSVTLQAYHYENGRWVRRATWLAKNSNYSSYTRYVRSSIAFKYRGRWRVRGYHSDSRHAPSYSSFSYFAVR